MIDAASPSVTIAQLYPDLLGITGDRGNVTVLQSRLTAAGVGSTVVPVHVGDALPDGLDVVVIGNGPLSAMRMVAGDLALKADALRAHVAQAGALLAVGAGAELLASAVEALDGEQVAGVGIFPFRVRRTRERRVGYVTATTAHGDLVGFEDHASSWSTDDGVHPYGRITAGRGTIGAPGVGAGEGVRVNDAYALNVQGPVLPLNPQLADALLRAACARRSIDYRVGDDLATADRLAEAARADIRRLATAKAPTSMGI